MKAHNAFLTAMTDTRVQIHLSEHLGIVLLFRYKDTLEELDLC
jgi:hypothetical protein